MAALLVLFTLFWLGTLDYRKLIKPDEGRYAEIAREMAMNGDLVTPRLNGIKYFEKPPLQYWATAASFNIFGQHDWSARLWPGLTSLAGVLLTAYVGMRLWGQRVGFFAAAIQASCLLYYAIGHMNTLDMGLSFFLQAALAGVLLSQKAGLERTEARCWMLLTWVAMGFGILSKGIVTLVICGGTLMLYSLWQRDFTLWKRLEWRRGPLLMLLVCAPWFIAVSLANPEFPHFFFIHEHFQRYLTTTHRRDEPIWYFIPVLIAGGLPWISLQLHALIKPAAAPSGTGGFSSTRLLQAWAVLIFVFFSTSGSKLPSYILPMFPALALLAALKLEHGEMRTNQRHVWIVVLIAFALCLLLPFIKNRGDEVTPPALYAAYMTWIAIGCALWLGCSLAALRAWLKQRKILGVALLSLGGLCASSSVMLGHEELAPSNSSYYLAQQVADKIPPSAPLYSIEMYDQTLTYYLKRTVTLVQYTDEMEFGLQQEPSLWIPTTTEFVQRWQQSDQAFALMSPDRYNRFVAEGLPMQLVARDTRRVIVQKPAPTQAYAALSHSTPDLNQRVRPLTP